MPLATTAQQNAALDAVVAALVDPATWRLHTGIPGTGTELPADGGYAAVAYTGSEWAAASGGAKSATVDFGTSTDAYADTADVWAIHDSTGAVILWDYLTESISVTAAGTAVAPGITLIWAQVY